MLLKKSQLVKRNGNPFKIKGKNYEIFKRIYYILYIVNVYSIRCNIKCKNEEKYSFLYKNYELEYKNIMEKYQDLDKKNLDIIKQF